MDDDAGDSLLPCLNKKESLRLCLGIVLHSETQNWFCLGEIGYLKSNVYLYSDEHNRNYNTPLTHPLGHQPDAGLGMVFLVKTTIPDCVVNFQHPSRMRSVKFEDNLRSSIAQSKGHTPFLILRDPSLTNLLWLELLLEICMLHVFGLCFCP